MVGVWGKHGDPRVSWTCSVSHTINSSRGKATSGLRILAFLLSALHSFFPQDQPTESPLGGPGHSFQKRSVAHTNQNSYIHCHQPTPLSESFLSSITRVPPCHQASEIICDVSFLWEASECCQQLDLTHAFVYPARRRSSLVHSYAHIGAFHFISLF